MIFKQTEGQDRGKFIGLGFDESTIIEAALPMTTSHDALRGHIRKALTTAHGVTDSYSSNGPWIHDVFPGHVVYQHEGKLLKRSYKVTQGAEGSDPKIDLGEKVKPQHAAYCDSATEALSVNFTVPEGIEEDTEALEAIRESFMEVREGVSLEIFGKAKESILPKSIPVKLIGPGWGSSAFYSKEMLKRDGPKVYEKGLHMYWNHPTETEEAERPEGDLNNLAAVLTENAHWEDNGVKGPGLYSKAKVFSDYATQVAEKGEDIGLSINAAIRTHEGTAEGKSGRIADQMVRAYSVDFVTKAGAKGAPIVPARESIRGLQPVRKEQTMDAVQEAALIKERDDLKSERDILAKEAADLKSSQNESLAVAAVTDALKEAGVEVSTKLIQRACKVYTMKENKIDPAWVEEVVKDFTESISPETEGRVRNMGDGNSNVITAEETDKRAENMFRSLGVKEAGITSAMKGGH